MGRGGVIAVKAATSRPTCATYPLVGITRREFTSALGALTSALLLPSRAEATTARKLSLEQLVKGSTRITLATPVQNHSNWETLSGQRTIVTYTRILVAEHWGEGDESEEMVRTLGGRVGKTQQKVMGEAALRIDEPCLVFLGQGRNGARQVLGMAQGYYRIQGDATDAKLFRSRELPKLVGDGPSAVEALHEKSVAEAADLVRGLR